MTHHRLVHCTLDEIVGTAARRHPVPATSAMSYGGRRWFSAARPPGGVALCWSGRLPGPQHLDVVWWLEVEPGATGVLAHLTAEAVPLTWPVPPPVLLAVHAWSARELATLAREAESGARAA